MPYIYPTAGFVPRLAVLCDQKAEIVEREAARYGFDRYGTDWRELAADGQIDVFDNCGPDRPTPTPALPPWGTAST